MAAFTTARSLSRGLAKKEFSAVELATRYLADIKAANPRCNAFITIDEEGALASAAAADELRARGLATPLTGVPMAHKDIFCTRGVLTTCASHMLHNFVSPYDATVVKKLNEAGAVCLGKANMDEFAMGSANITSYHGNVINPWIRYLVRLG